MKSLISYIIKRNLYHIIFLICVLITGNETVRSWPWPYGGFVTGGGRSPLWFWFLHFVILQMWYFSSTNYNFISLDFIIYCIMLIFIRCLMFVAGMFSAKVQTDFGVVAMVELFLSLILTIIAMLVGTNPTFYSSSIHYPSFIILLICCLFFIFNTYYIDKSGTEKDEAVLKYEQDIIDHSQHSKY